jgi:hypothetical protein
MGYDIGDKIKYDSGVRSCINGDEAFGSIEFGTWLPDEMLACQRDSTPWSELVMLLAYREVQGVALLLSQSYR